MTDCEHLRPQYEAYALGVLEGEERAAIEAHLDRGCVTCTAGVAQARTVVAQLALAAPDEDPPASLRARVLPEALEPARAWIPVWAWAAAAALFLLAAYTTYQTRQLSAQLHTARQELQEQRARAAQLEAERRQLQQVRSVLGNPETRGVELRAAAAGASLPALRAYWHEKDGLVLTAANVPAPADDRTYQLWVVPKKGVPISAGLFRPQEGNVLLVEKPPPTAIGDAAALAVTDEPAGGRPQPTTSPRWVGPVR